MQITNDHQRSPPLSLSEKYLIKFVVTLSTAHRISVESNAIYLAKLTTILPPSPTFKAKPSNSPARGARLSIVEHAIQSLV